MSLPVFWHPELTARVGASVALEGSEGRHAAVVRRIGVGERVVLTDGQGLRATCVVTAAGKTGIVATVEEVAAEPLVGPFLTVAQAIPKGDRAELTVEVLTEIGADEIVPWAAHRSIGQWRGERRAKALAKWQNASREAAKQSRRARFPQVSDVVDLTGLVGLVGRCDLAVVLHEEAASPVAELDLAGAGSVLLIVGPEGGVSPEEIEALTAAGAHVCRLGPTVLRTSTAGLAAAAALLSRTPRWGRPT